WLSASYRRRIHVKMRHIAGPAISNCPSNCLSFQNVRCWLDADLWIDCGDVGLGQCVAHGSGERAEHERAGYLRLGFGHCGRRTGIEACGRHSLWRTQEAANPEVYPTLDAHDGHGHHRADV